MMLAVDTTAVIGAQNRGPQPRRAASAMGLSGVNRLRDSSGALPYSYVGRRLP